MTTRRPTPFRFVALAAGLVLLATVAVAGESLVPGFPSCVPADGNALVSATLEPPAGWSSVRTYFRKAGSADLYFLEMREGGEGRFWAVLPLPESQTTSVEMQVVATDAQGRESRSALTSAPVTAGCTVALTTDQAGAAKNLVVGETVTSQQGREVLGFRCEGVISRIDVAGELRPDELCRRIVMAKDDRRYLIPLIALGAGGGAYAIIEHDDHDEASPSRP